MYLRALSVSAFLLCFTVGSTQGAAPSVSEADAQLALRIASGLSSSAPPEMRVADVVSSPLEGAAPLITILDAVQLLRGSRGFMPSGATGTALMEVMDLVQLQEDTVRNFMLARAFRFSGRVLDENGRPVDAAVELTDASGRQRAASQFDANKGFELPARAEPLRARVHSEYPASPGYTGTVYFSAVLPATEMVAISGDTQRDLTRPVRPPTGFITGTITGGSFARQQVSAPVTLDGESRGSGITWPTGERYDLECPAGVATLYLSGSNGNKPYYTLEYTWPKTVTVAPGETVVENVIFPKTVTITGEVRGGPDWPVWMVSLNDEVHGGGSLRSYVQDPDPSGFTLQVVPGKYKVTVIFHRKQGTSSSQYGYYQSIDVPQAGGHFTLPIPAEPPNRTITGIVLDPGGRPVQAAEVSVGRSYASEIGYASVTVLTDARGRYTLTAPEGRYYVYVRPPSF